MDDVTESAPSCNMLKQPLSLSELIESGTKFEINTNFDEGISDEILNELNFGSDDEVDDDKNTVDREALVSPWTRSFDELKQHMLPINEHLHKKIVREGVPEQGRVPENARVCIRYNAYWEGEGVPFDSSILRGSTYSFYTGRGDVIAGLEAAVNTMYRGEHAQFVISYHLLFREMGCPPRVKPLADGLFIIELVSFTEVGDLNAAENVPEQDRNKFAVVIDKVKQIHLKGLDFFGQGMHRNAIRAFEKAVDVLDVCHLNDDEEERQQTAFLLKLYTNLAVCYLKVHAPTRTCLMCKEIRRLTGGKPSCKALFQEGRALFMLGEYTRARAILTRCLTMEPQNMEINGELKKLDERHARYKKNEKEMWSNAMGAMKKSTQLPHKSAGEISGENDGLDQFEKDMFDLMKSFKEQLGTESLKLPPGLTENEIGTVNDLASNLELKLSISPLDESTYVLSKK